MCRGECAMSVLHPDRALARRLGIGAVANPFQMRGTGWAPVVVLSAPSRAAHPSIRCGSVGLGVRGDTGVDEDAGFVADGPGVVPGFDPDHVAGFDSELGSVVEPDVHLA